MTPFVSLVVARHCALLSTVDRFVVKLRCPAPDPDGDVSGWRCKFQRLLAELDLEGRKGAGHTTFDRHCEA